MHASISVSHPKHFFYMFRLATIIAIKLYIVEEEICKVKAAVILQVMLSLRYGIC